jgi:hypothetical protein
MNPSRSVAASAAAVLLAAGKLNLMFASFPGSKAVLV